MAGVERELIHLVGSLGVELGLSDVVTFRMYEGSPDG